VEVRLRSADQAVTRRHARDTVVDRHADGSGRRHYYFAEFPWSAWLAAVFDFLQTR
jgi:hypothetical protein